MARSMKFCLFCKREGIEKKAVVKYYLKRSPGQAYYGWIPVCKSCAESFSNAGYELIYFSGKKFKDANNGDDNCDHFYYKKNLVTMRSDCLDCWKCEKCGKEIFRIGNPNGGQDARPK